MFRSCPYNSCTATGGLDCQGTDLMLGVASCVEDGNRRRLFGRGEASPSRQSSMIRS